MDGTDSVLEALADNTDDENEFAGDLTLIDDEIQMLESLAIDSAAVSPPQATALPPTFSDGGGGGSHVAVDSPRDRNRSLSVNKKKNKRKKKTRRAKSGAHSITDINRFVMDTCRRLREKKSYLVWTAVGCLGVSVVQDLVKEVEVLQSFGGQKTADGNRLRTGGGILWNILKTREPKAYKEIMAKGRQFEKQFRQPKNPEASKSNEDKASPNIRHSGRTMPKVPERSNYLTDTNGAPDTSYFDKRNTCVLNRIREPIVYDDLYEEGELRD